MALAANFLASPITLSENLAPTTITRSALFTAKFETFVPCIPIIPVYLSFVPSNAPLPIRVSHTGASILSASFFNSGEASAAITPPPAMINGLSLLSISFTACSKSSALIVLVILSIDSGAFAS